LNSLELAQLCSTYALDKKGELPILLKVDELSSITDYLLIISGRSDRHVQSLAEAVHLGLKKDHAEVPLAVEGQKEGKWVLLDYGNVMVHIFQQAIREFYDLEGLWSEAEKVTVEESTVETVR